MQNRKENAIPFSSNSKGEVSRVTAKHLVVWFIFCVFSACAPPALANETGIGIKEVAVVEGGLALACAVAANNPKGWGTVYVGLSLLMASDSVEAGSDASGYLAGALVVGALGAWLMSKEGAPPEVVGTQLFLGSNAIIIPFALLSKRDTPQSPGASNSLSFRMTAGGQQMALSYRMSF